MQIRFVCILVVLSLLVSCFVINVYSADLNISAECAVVMIADTNEVVFEKNPHKKQGIASTTKIMSAIVALESNKLYSTTTIKSEDISVEGTSMGLKAGDNVSLLCLVKGMLISSGNDAANVTATFIAGGKTQFAKLMNNKCHTIGMTSTNFVNPSGLTEDGHYSTAYDMALLGSYAVKNPVFCSICSLKSAKVSYGERGSVTLYNHNKFIKMYDGAFGIKTGFTKASGRCLVTAVKRNNVILVCVTLNAPDDWQDHKKLYDYAFSRVKTFTFNADTPDIIVVGSSKKQVSTAFSREIIIPYVDKKPSVSTLFYIPPFVYGGVKLFDIVGNCTFIINNKKAFDIPVISTENADNLIILKSDKPIDKIKEFLRKGLSQRQT